MTLNSSASVLGILRAFNAHTREVGQVAERLSTGLRINRAADDAAGLAIGTKLQTDAKVYSQAVRNVRDGSSYLEQGHSALREIRSILTRMQELTIQSANGTVSDSQRQGLEIEFQELRLEYNRIVATTEFNGTRIFDTGNEVLRIQAGYGLPQRIDIELAGGSSTITTTTTTTTPDGTFGAVTTYAAGDNPKSVFLADLNGDGVPDLVTADNASSTLSVFLGNGDGTFQARQSFDTGSDPRDAIAADVNNDGILDLIVARRGADRISVLLGNGDGTFQARQNYVTGDDPVHVAVGDFNGDGILDLVNPNWGGTAGTTLSVLLGNGDGTFQAHQQYTTGAGPRQVAVGDVNGDGILDLVAADESNSTASVLLGNGDGTFGARQAFSTGSKPEDVLLADFNNDGILDIATSDELSSTVSVLLGNGNGTFQAKQSFTVGAKPQALSTADLDGDGVLDIVTADENGASLSVLFGNGDGTFQARQTLSVGGVPEDVAIGDLDNDGVLDLVYSDASQDAAGVLLGNGTTTTTTNTTTISYIVEPLEPMSIATQGLALAVQSELESYMSTVDGVTGLYAAGTARLDFAKNFVQTLAAEYEQARSRVMDADIAEEAGKLARAKIRRQAAAAMLAQAQTDPEIVLALLGGPKRVA